MSNGTQNTNRRAKVPASVWRWDHHQPGGTFKSAASNGKVVVVVGDSGLIKTSSDGFNWTDRNSGQKRNIYGICYSPEKKLFVAVGYHGIIITSGTGTIWKQRVAFTQDAPSLKGVAYGGGRFVAVGVKGVVKISSDGKTWRNSDNQPGKELNGIFYANGLFVAPSISGSIFTSPDGDTWKAKKVDPQNNNLYSVVFGRNIWVVGGAHGACFTSPDGVKWTARNTGTDNYLMDLVYTGKEFVANGNSDGYASWGSMILVSIDGTFWMREKAPSGFNPGGKPCFSTLTCNTQMGDRVFAFGARLEIISKNIHNQSSGESPEPPPEAQQNITITSPAGGEKWEAGAMFDLVWSAPTVQRNVKIEYSTDNGNTWIPVDNDTKNDGLRDWTIPKNVSSTCRIKVSDVGGPSFGISGLFAIVPEGSGKRISVISPKKGEQLRAGSVIDIKWTSRRIPNHVKIEYSIDNGKKWLPLDNDTKNDGLRDWVVPNTLSTKCYIKVSDPRSGTYGLNTGAFSIINPRITVTSPQDGHHWLAGSVQRLKWTSRGIIGNVKIELSSDNGATWQAVDNDTRNDGIYDWTVPELISDKCKIRVSEKTGTTKDVSTGTFTIVEPDRRVQTPPPGLNTLSDAVGKMKQGYVIELEVGTYVQTEPVIPPPAVTDFTISGKGMGASIIHFKNSDGILQPASRVGRCHISGLTLTAAQADDGQPHDAIRMKGSPRGNGSGILIRDVEILAGPGDNAWDSGVHLTNAFDAVLENVRVFGPETQTGAGIRLFSCVSALLTGVKLTGLDGGIYLDKAADNDIEGNRKHGNQQITVAATDFTSVAKGIMLDHGSREVTVRDCAMREIRLFGIRERSSSGGGNHVIDGGIFRFAADSPGNLHMFWLQNHGSVVNRVTADGAKTKSNGLTVSAKTPEGIKPVQHIRVSGCVFMNFTTGIFLQMGHEGILTGNICRENTNGIFIGKDSSANCLTANIAPVTDQGKNNKIL